MKVFLLGFAALLALAFPLMVFRLNAGPLDFYCGDGFPPGQAAYIFMRPAGHIAFVLLFIQIMLGRFRVMELHKTMAIPVLALSWTHPLLFAWAKTLRGSHKGFYDTFFPNPYQNQVTFWFLFGALALYGTTLAATAALCRKKLPEKLWRGVHLLVFPSFFCGWFHSSRIGAEVRDQPVGWMYNAMAVVAALLVVEKLAGLPKRQGAK